MRCVRRRADAAQQLGDPIVALRAPADAVDDERLGDQRADAHARIERRIGVLEDHLRPAPHRLHLAPRQRAGRAAVDRDLPRPGHEVEDRLAGRRLAGAALADEAERLAGLDVEGDVLTAEAAPPRPNSPPRWRNETPSRRTVSDGLAGPRGSGRSGEARRPVRARRGRRGAARRRGARAYRAPSGARRSRRPGPVSTIRPRA